MMVLDHGCKDSLPIGLPQTGDVDFEIVQSKPHVADHASADIAQVGPICSRRISVAWVPPGAVCSPVQRALYTFLITRVTFGNLSIIGDLRPKVCYVCCAL